MGEGSRKSKVESQKSKVKSEKWGLKKLLPHFYFLFFTFYFDVLILKNY